MIMQLFSFGVFAQDTVNMEYDVYMEAEDYQTASIPLSVVNDEKMSGGKCIKINTDISADNGPYYVDYKVNVKKAGAYNFKIDSFPVQGNGYSEIAVSVNGGENTNLYFANIIEAKKSGMSTIELNYLTGFKAGNNTIRITILYPRPKDRYYIATFDYFTLKKADWGISNVKVQGQKIFNICENGSDISLDCFYSEPAAEAKKLTCDITDYFGEKFYNTVFKVEQGETSTHINLPKMDINHYTVNIYDGEKSLYELYISVVKPLSERNVIQDSPFGCDAILSILGMYDYADDNLDALKLAGVSWLRDRFILNTFNSADGVYNYEKWDSYSMQMMDKAKQHGFKVLNMLTGMPSYLIKNQIKGDHFPTDMVSTYKVAYELAKVYNGKVDSWEIFNEPEAAENDMSLKETADKLVNFIAAMSIGIRDADENAMVATPGFANSNNEVLDLSVRNSVQNYVDTIDYHNHTGAVTSTSLQRMRPDQNININQTLRNYGITDKPIWNSEAGISCEDSIHMSTEMQRRQAEYIVVMHSQLLEFADRAFSYIFNYKKSGGFNWFSLDSHGPNRIYNTYSAMTDILGEAIPVGKLNGLEENEDGFIYKNGENEIIVLFADTARKISLPLKDVKLLDILGRDMTQSTDENGNITIDIGPTPVYVKVKGEFDKELYTPNGYDKSQYKKISNKKSERVLISQVYPESTRTDAKFNGYQITEAGTNVIVTVTNLNDEAMSGELIANTYNGWKIIPQKVNINVNPYQTATQTFRLEKTESIVDNLKSSVEFTGLFNGEYTNTSVTDVVSPAEIKYEWNNEFKGIYDYTKYSNNISQNGIQEIDGDGQTYLTHKFTFDISTKDKWVYPRFMFDKTQNFGGSTGIVVRYEAPVNFADIDIHSRIYIYEENGSTYLVKSPYEMKSGINEVIIPWTGFKLVSGSDPDYQLTSSSIAGFSIGLNSGSSAGGGTLEVPEYKILKVGVYNVVTEDPGIARVDESYPENNSYISDSPDKIEFKFSDSPNCVKDGTVFMYIDGKREESVFENNTAYTKNTLNLDKGAHTAEICYRVDGMAAFNKKISFTIGDENIVYSDVSEDYWAWKPIEQLSYRKVISGYSGMFFPDESVTRAEFIKIINKAFNFKGEYTENPFSDLNGNEWYAGDIKIAYAKGLTDGIFDECIDADKPITREQMAALLYRAVNTAGIVLENKVAKQVFLDKSDFQNYSKQAIQYFQQTGILNGRGNRMFEPNGMLTRAEAAKVVYEVLKNDV